MLKFFLKSVDVISHFDKIYYLLRSWSFFLSKSEQFEKVSHAILNLLVNCNKLVHSPQIPVLNIVLLYLWSWKVQFGSYFQRAFSFIKQLICLNIWNDSVLLTLYDVTLLSIS